VDIDTSARGTAQDLAVNRLGLCLEFANTLHWHASDRPRETLRSYEDFLAWAAAQGSISHGEFSALTRHARREAQAAAAAYGRVKSLREAIYRIFVARIAGKAPARRDAALVNEELQHALAHYHIAFGADGPNWRRVAHAAALDEPLWPIVQSAAELLLSKDLRERVGQCADPAGCGWLFLDLSKNRSRRWCSMQDCGNRAKQRRLQAAPK
jgi:predicted RNA-binding Zn ribbon-like protein